MSENIAESTERLPTHIHGIPVAGADFEVPVPEVPRDRRVKLTKLQIRVLSRLKERGPACLSHGTRSLCISGNLMTMKSDGHHALISSGMVAAAKGNYPASYFKITRYGEKCLERGYRDGNFHRPFQEVMSHWYSSRDAGGA